MAKGHQGLLAYLRLQIALVKSEDPKGEFEMVKEKDMRK